jgi:transcriptional regulator with XRE-family HTH domain
MIDPGAVCDIAKRIKEERERLKLTQAALAQIAGVSKLTQLKYESGQTIPSAAYLGLLARLGGDVLYIVTGQRTPEIREVDGDSIVISAEESALIDNYRHADEADQTAARRILTALAQQKKAA